MEGVLAMLASSQNRAEELAERVAHLSHTARRQEAHILALQAMHKHTHRVLTQQHAQVMRSVADVARDNQADTTASVWPSGGCVQCAAVPCFMAAAE